MHDDHTENQQKVCGVYFTLTYNQNWTTSPHNLFSMVYLITIVYLFLGASTIYFSTIYLDNLNYLFHIEECFAFMYVCALNLFMLPTEFRRGCWIAWNCSYMWFSSNKWVLGVKPKSSEGRVNSLHLWDITVTPSLSTSVPALLT